MIKKKTRHELKYVVNLQRGEEFMLASGRFCLPDRHAGPDGFYEVLSVYYDTADLRFYWDRQESIGFRRKVRLRRYAINNRVEEKLFLEVKEKHKHLIGKQRFVLPSEAAAALLAAQPAELALGPMLAGSLPSRERDEVGFLHERLQLLPTVNVRYLRRALACPIDPTLRITLDKRLTASLPALSDYDSTTEGFFLDPALAVLEIKSERSVPLWALALLRRFEFSRGRYSKYCAAIDLMRGTASSMDRAKRASCTISCGGAARPREGMLSGS